MWQKHFADWLAPRFSERSGRVALCVVMLSMAVLWIGIGIESLSGSKNTVFGYISFVVVAFFFLEARMAFVRPWR